MNRAERENHRRKTVVRWVWSELQRKKVVTLTEIETKFRMYCEGIMKEAVTYGLFSATNTGDDIGWYLSVLTADDNATQFSEKLEIYYKTHQ